MEIHIEKLRYEDRRFVGEAEDRIECSVVTSDGESIKVKGAVPTGGCLPKKDFYLAGEYKRTVFHFFAVLLSEEELISHRECEAILAGEGFRRTIPGLLVKKFGKNAAFVLQRNPFIMLPWPSASFDRCDKLWLRFGRPEESTKRQLLFMVNNMLNNGTGHTWYKLDFLLSAVKNRFKSKYAGFRIAKLGQRSGAIRVHSRGTLSQPETWISARDHALAEQTIADHVMRMNAKPSRWPAVEPGSMEPDQIEAVQKATSANVGCLVGGAGTGKTFSLAQILKSIGDLGNCALLAPTGKAAVRCNQAVSEALSGAKVRGRLKATTIHKLLFQRDREPKQFYIVDEASMIDVELMADLFSQIIPSTSCVLFVGDAGQLPPVGPGAPFRDFQHLPSYGEIQLTRRNGGLILESSQLIRRGGRFNTANSIDEGNLIYAPTNRNLLVETIAEEYLHSTRVNGKGSTQVLCVTNKQCAAINAYVRAKLFPDLPTGGRQYPFCKDDQVINTANGYFIPAFRYEQDPEAVLDIAGNVYVANGEQGQVVEDNGTSIIIKVQAPERYVTVWQKKIEPDEAGVTGTTWRHAYAITTHKCVVPETLIQTEFGTMQIQDFQAGKVWDGFEWVDAKRLPNNPVSECLKVTCENGYEFTATKYHRCEVIRDGIAYMVEASEIAEGDWMRVKLGHEKKPGTSLYSFLTPDVDTRAVVCNTPAEMSETLATYLGLLVADGSLFKSGFRVVKRHKDVIDWFANATRELFGIEATNEKRSDCNAFMSEVYSVYVRKWLMQNFVGLAPKSKQIPKKILCHDKSIWAAFIRGLFEDGCANVKNGKCDHVEFHQSSRSMLKCVQQMLLGLGIVSTIPDDRNKLYIYGYDSKLFKERVGFISGMKNRALSDVITTRKRERVPVGESTMRSVEINEETRSTRQTAIRRGFVTKENHLGFLDDEWHYVRVESIENVERETTCLRTASGRFLQNGFPHGNSQGSDWPYVICALDNRGGHAILDRSLIYTMVTRAKVQCLLTGEIDVAYRAIKTSKIDERNTMLVRMMEKWKGGTVRHELAKN